MQPTLNPSTVQPRILGRLYVPAKQFLVCIFLVCLEPILAPYGANIVQPSDSISNMWYDPIFGTKKIEHTGF